jgi:hypothetical protein
MIVEDVERGHGVDVAAGDSNLVDKVVEEYARFDKQF